MCKIYRIFHPVGILDLHHGHCVVGHKCLQLTHNPGRVSVIGYTHVFISYTEYTYRSN